MLCNIGSKRRTQKDKKEKLYFGRAHLLHRYMQSYTSFSSFMPNKTHREREKKKTSAQLGTNDVGCPINKVMQLTGPHALRQAAKKK